MEKTLALQLVGLNPYSNGIYSMSGNNYRHQVRDSGRLNPYSNGIYSMRLKHEGEPREVGEVLILILMEYTL